MEFEFPDSSECKDTGVISVVKYKPLSFLLHLLCWLGFSVDSADALFRTLHSIDTKGRWLTVVTGYRKDALGGRFPAGTGILLFTEFMPAV